MPSTRSLCKIKRELKTEPKIWRLLISSCTIFSSYKDMLKSTSTCTYTQKQEHIRPTDAHIYTVQQSGFLYFHKVTHSTFLSSVLTTDLNPVDCPDDVVSSEGLFVFLKSPRNIKQDCTFASCDWSLSNQESGGKNSNVTLCWDSTPVLQRVSCSLIFFLNEVYYLKVSPEVQLSIVYMGTEDFRGEVWVAPCGWLEKCINLCSTVNQPGNLESLGRVACS